MGKAKDIYEMLASKVEKPVVHDLVLMREGGVHEKLENVELKEVVREEHCKLGFWRFYSSGIVFHNERGVGVYASEYIYDQETSESEKSVYIVLKEPLRVTKRSRGAWRERVWRNKMLQYESVPFEESVSIELPIDPELVKEVLEMLKP